MRKAVGYIRYGKGKRDAERQRKAIDAYCTRENMEVIEWIGEGVSDFGDVAYGNWMGNRKIDAVVAAIPADVTDSVYEFYAYRCKLRMRNSDLVVTKWEDYAGYSLYRKIMDTFTDTFCRMEMEHDPVKNEGGRMRKVAMGGYIGGQPPMGYKAENGKLIVNPDEVPAVLFIMEQKHAGKTKVGTVEELNARGYKTRRGGKFQISTVQGVWNNEMLYRGYYRYKGSDEWVKGQHEAILKDKEEE